MMARQSPRQTEIVGRVMHEFKHGELEGAQGGKVRNPRQAIAIGLSEAGASNQQSPGENRGQRHRTEEKERQGQTAKAQKEGRGAKPRRGESRGAQQKQQTRAELYDVARARGVKGRSRMSKDELQRAVSRN